IERRNLKDVAEVVCNNSVEVIQRVATRPLARPFEQNPEIRSAARKGELKHRDKMDTSHCRKDEQRPACHDRGPSIKRKRPPSQEIPDAKPRQKQRGHATDPPCYRRRTHTCRAIG